MKPQILVPRAPIGTLVGMLHRLNPNMPFLSAQPVAIVSILEVDYSKIANRAS